MNRILLVTASPESALNLSRLLSRHLNVELLQAGSDAEALELTSRTGVDLVVVDVRLPQIDGFDLCSRIHEEELHREVPVLLLTTPEGETYPEVKALSIGPGEIFTLPTPGSNLLAWVNILLKITTPHRLSEETAGVFSSLPVDIYRILLDRITDAVMWLDISSGTVKIANAACEKLTGYPLELLIGKTLEDLILSEARDKVRAMWTQTLSTRNAVSGDFTFVRRSGMHVQLHLTLQTYRSDSQDGVVVLLQEVTETGDIPAIHGAGYHIGDTVEFLRALSHEVRNPLTGISTNVQYMQMTFADTDTQKEIYQDILEAVGRLDRLFREVVEYVRPVELRVVNVKPAQLVKDALDQFDSDTFARRKIELDVQVDASLPEISVDESRFHHVMGILLTHCLRETGEMGKITIAGDSSLDEVTLVLAYSGGGLNPQQLSRLFQPVAALKSADPGLGLAYVKRIMDEHSCKFDVETGAGKGTQFTLRFPLRSTTNE